MKTITRIALLITTSLLFVGGANAAAVVCGGVGNRTVTITPGLVGGFCYAQNDNLQNADITAVSTTFLNSGSSRSCQVRQ